MLKELVIVYDAPSVTYSHIIMGHFLVYYLKFFDRIRVVYWSKEGFSEVFEKEEGKFVFYPYCGNYNSGYVSGLKYMIWIGKTLFKICGGASKDVKMLFLTVIPVWAGVPALLVAKLKGKKIILRLEAEKINYLSFEEKFYRQSKFFSFIKIFIVKLIYYLTVPFYDFVIGISEGTAKEAKSYGAKKLKTIAIPININLFSSGKKERKSAKNTILFVGQIKKTKGADNLIKALRLLKKDGAMPPKLIIAGDIMNPKDKPFLKELKETAKGLDVEFLGWVAYEKLPSVYNKADIFVLPSYSESLGISIMEAMASGLPVIASDLSGPRDLVENNKTGFLVKEGDVNGIKEKLETLLGNPDLRESMGKDGRQRIEEIMNAADEGYKNLWKYLGIY